MWCKADGRGEALMITVRSRRSDLGLSWGREEVKLLVDGEELCSVEMMVCDGRNYFL
jgi:hypothetical protein